MDGSVNETEGLTVAETWTQSVEHTLCLNTSGRDPKGRYRMYLKLRRFSETLLSV